MTDATLTEPDSRLDKFSVPPNPHGSFVWYELLTSDPAAARAFYEPVVGWNIEAEGHGEPEYRMIDAGDGLVGGVLTLTDDMKAHGARPAWVGYVGVDDVDRTVAAIEDRGGKVLMPPKDVPNAGRIAMVCDPQGAPFYVMKPTPPASNPDAQSTAFAPSRDKHGSWNELATSDQQAALHFYATLFGWVKGDSMPMGEMGDYIFLNHHHDMIGAVMTAPPGRPTMWTHYFRVNGIEGVVERIKANGGQVLWGPHEVPGGDWALNGVDPQGAPFGFVGSK